MPPELTLALIGIAVAAAAGIQQLIKAVVKRQVDRMQEADEEARKDREQKRQREMEEMRQKTAKAQEDAEQAKAIGQNLTNLTSAVMKFAETNAQEQFANREMLSNHIQTIGDLSMSVDRVGTILEENTSVTRGTGAKADNVTQAVSDLFNRFARVFPTDKPMDERFEELKLAIIDALEKRCEELKRTTSELPALVPPPDAATGAAGDTAEGSAAA